MVARAGLTVMAQVLSWVLAGVAYENSWSDPEVMVARAIVPMGCCVHYGHSLRTKSYLHGSAVEDVYVRVLIVVIVEGHPKIGSEQRMDSRGVLRLPLRDVDLPRMQELGKGNLHPVNLVSLFQS